MAGKGDRARNIGEKFRRNYERIYGAECRLNHEHDDECRVSNDDLNRK